MLRLLREEAQAGAAVGQVDVGCGDRTTGSAAIPSTRPTLGFSAGTLGQAEYAGTGGLRRSEGRLGQCILRRLRSGVKIRLRRT